MKRYFAALLLTIITALATSCWKTGEDWSLCEVSDNFTLKLRLEDGADHAFVSEINSVDVFLFNADKLYHDHKRVEKSELDLFRGVTFTVKPGIYHVVCWANVSANSRLSAMDRSSNFENSYIEIASTASGCPIYYAPYKTPETRSGGAAVTRAGADYSIYAVDVLPQGETVKELRLARAHRTVQVYIKGFETLSDYDGVNPVVEMRNTSGKFDFLLCADLTPRDLRMRSGVETVNSVEMLTAQIHSALVPVTPDMDIRIRYGSDDRVSATVNLQQYIADNNIADDSVVPILITYAQDVSVSVTLPNWGDNPVEPEL